MAANAMRDTIENFILAQIEAAVKFREISILHCPL